MALLSLSSCVSLGLLARFVPETSTLLFFSHLLITKTFFLHFFQSSFLAGQRCRFDFGTTRITGALSIGAAIQWRWASAIAEGTWSANEHLVVFAFLTSTLAKKVGSRYALSTWHVTSVVASSYKARIVAICARAALNTHKCTGVVIREVRLPSLPMQTAVPGHGENVVTVGENSWHAHLVPVRKAVLVCAARWSLATVVAILHPAAVLKYGFAMPGPVVNVLHGNQRARVEAALVIVAMPFDIDVLSAAPDAGRVARRVARFGHALGPNRRTGSCAVRAVAIDGIVRSRVFEVEVGGNEGESGGDDDKIGDRHREGPGERKER